MPLVSGGDGWQVTAQLRTPCGLGAHARSHPPTITLRTGLHPPGGRRSFPALPTRRGGVSGISSPSFADGLVATALTSPTGARVGTAVQQSSRTSQLPTEPPERPPGEMRRDPSDSATSEGRLRRSRHPNTDDVVTGRRRLDAVTRSAGWVTARKAGHSVDTIAAQAGVRAATVSRALLTVRSVPTPGETRTGTAVPDRRQVGDEPAVGPHVVYDQITNHRLPAQARAGRYPVERLMFERWLTDQYQQTRDWIAENPGNSTPDRDQPSPPAMPIHRPPHDQAPTEPGHQPEPPVPRHPAPPHTPVPIRHLEPTAHAFWPRCQPEGEDAPRCRP